MKAKKQANIKERNAIKAGRQPGGCRPILSPYYGFFVGWTGVVGLAGGVIGLAGGVVEPPTGVIGLAGGVVEPPTGVVGLAGGRCWFVILSSSCRNIERTGFCTSQSNGRTWDRVSPPLDRADLIL
jgi:hypothetical protein